MGVLLLLVIGGMGTRTVHAQERLYPPFDNFTPGFCAVASDMVEFLSYRDNPDTSAYAPQKDTLLRTTRDSIGLCDERYHGIAEQDRDLLNLARVKLASGNDAAAAAARRRYLATLTTRPAREQAWAYFLIVLDNVMAKPPRMAAAREAVAHIDRLPFPDMGKASFLAHRYIALTASAVWDEPLVKAEAAVAIAQYRKLTAGQRQWFSVEVGDLFQMKAEQELRLTGIAQARAVLDTARETLPSQSEAYRLIMETLRMYSVVGLPGPAIEAKFWFRAPDAVPRPAKGRVTFVSNAKHYCGKFCFDRYRALGRYVTRFGNRGFELVNTTKTLGFYPDTAPATPQDEARFDSLYFLGNKQLPGMLAVVETRYAWRVRDGRRMDALSPQEKNYPSAAVILVDKQGVVRYVAMGWNSMLEEPLAKFIERLLAEP